MSHEIYEINGKDSMAYVGETPWHGLGQKLTENASFDAWLAEANMLFNFITSPVTFWDKDFTQHEMPGQMVVYRDDTKEAMTVASTRYQITQPREVAETFRALCEAGNLTMHTMGSLQNGRKFWCLAKINDVNDLSVSDTDKLELYTLIASSSDRSLSTIGKYTSVRVVCNNTLDLSLNANNGGTTIRIPHSTKFDAAKFREQMGLTQERVDQVQESIRKLHKTPISRDDAIKIFTHLVSSPEERSSKTFDADSFGTKARTVTKILNSYDNAPGAEQTLWGAVNAVTHSIDFNPSARSVDTRLNGAWFGQGAALKNEAFEMVQDESLLESIIETTAEKIRQTGTSGNDTLAGLAALVDF